MLLHPDDAAHGGAAFIILNSVSRYEMNHRQANKMNVKVDTNLGLYIFPFSGIRVYEFIAFNKIVLK